MKPQRIPWVIDTVRGMRIIVKNAERLSSIRSNRIWPTLLNIEAPTSIKTGAVAYEGTIPAKGARKRQGKKHNAVNTEVSPVRPPTLIPAILSIYAVPEELPTTPAPRVATESTIKACRKLRGFPLSSSRFDACATPMKVEIESNRSVNNM